MLFNLFLIITICLQQAFLGFSHNRCPPPSGVRCRRSTAYLWLSCGRWQSHNRKMFLMPQSPLFGSLWHNIVLTVQHIQNQQDTLECQLAYVTHNDTLNKSNKKLDAWLEAPGMRDASLMGWTCHGQGLICWRIFNDRLRRGGKWGRRVDL